MPNFSKVAVPLIFPPALWGFPFPPQFLPNTCYYVSFWWCLISWGGSHSSGCAVIFHCGFGFLLVIGGPFLMLSSPLYVEKCLFKPLTDFLIGLSPCHWVRVLCIFTYNALIRNMVLQVFFLPFCKLSKVLNFDDVQSYHLYFWRLRLKKKKKKDCPTQGQDPVLFAPKIMVCDLHFGLWSILS